MSWSFLLPTLGSPKKNSIGDLKTCSEEPNQALCKEEQNLIFYKFLSSDEIRPRRYGCIELFQSKIFFFGKYIYSCFSYLTVIQYKL